MSSFQLIGNTLEFEGQAVGRLRTDVPATLRARAEEALENAYVNEDAKSERQQNREFRDELFKDLREQFAKLAEAGMVEIKDIETVFDEFSKVSA